jgi:glutaredoxin
MIYIIGRLVPRCVYCEMAKNLASKAGIDYQFFDLTKEPELQEFMELHNLRTVPAIFKDSVLMENYIGGATEFQKYVYTV